MAEWKPKSAKPVQQDGWRPKSAKPVAPPVEPDEPVALDNAESPAEPVPADPGLGRTVVGGLVEGFFKGGSDEIMGGLASATKDPEAGMAWTQPDGKAKFLKTEGDIYRASRDTEREKQKGAFEHHPVATVGSQIAGDVLSDFVIKQLGIPVGSKHYQAAMGAVTGFLSGDAELTGENPETKKAALQTGIGGGLGYAVPYAAKWGGKGLSKAAPALKRFAEERAVKVLGRDLNGLLQGGMGKVREMGRDLLDSDVVRFGTGTETAANRLKDLADDRGQTLGAIIDMLDEKMLPEDRINVLGLVQKLRDKLTSNLPPAEKAVGGTVSKEIDNIADLARPIGKKMLPEGGSEVVRHTKDLGIKEAEETLKRPLQKRLKYDREQGPGQEGLKRLASAIRQEVEDTAQGVAEKRAPELADLFKTAKKKYGQAAEGLGIAEKQMGRDIKNRMISPTDYGAGMSGAADMVNQPMQSSLTGMGLALAHKLARENGSSAAAVTADKMASAAQKLKLRQAGIALQKYGPKMGSYLVREILRDDPDLLNMFEQEQEGQP